MLRLLKGWVKSIARPAAASRSGRDYRRLVGQLLQSKPRQEAMEIAVGGFDGFGDVQLVILDHFGMRDGAYLIDVGCGSGRLTRRMAKLARCRYLGTDVSEVMLDYARTTCARPDFRFALVEHLSIPEEDSMADMVVFFSVGTHLLHEEFFVYLEEARRVLRSGGRIIFSFLDLRTQACRPIFTQMTSKVRAKHSSPHLDMFMGRDDIPTWAELLGLNLIDVVSGDDAGILPSQNMTAVLGPDLPPIRLGQSIAVLEKP